MNCSRFGSFCTPHLGYAVDYPFERIYKIAIDNTRAFRWAKRPNIIDSQALRS